MSRGSNTMREVSRVHSTRRLKLWSEKDRRRNKKLQPPYGKEQIRRKKKLNPHYVAGFIDGEGCFSVSIGKHKTLKRGYEGRPEFEIEVRKDDQEVLERIVMTIGAGRIYDCSYERYGWFPHAKYKITSIWEMKEIVLMLCNKEHLSDKGFKKIFRLRAELRMLGKKARTYGCREGAGKPLAPWRSNVAM